jgi:hypothetical protein
VRAESAYGLQLDCTEQSIRTVDQILSIHKRLYAEGRLQLRDLADAAEVFGCYYGEVLARHRGATWGLGEYLMIAPAAAVQLPDQAGTVVYLPNVVKAR